SVNVAGPSGVVHLQNTHCATGVLSRHLAINRRAVAVEPIIEPVFSCANAEALKKFLAFHLLCSFQVADGFIDGLNQGAGPRDILFENLPMRFESSEFFEFSPAQDFVDTLQLEAQLSVKEDL